jgi:NADH-quinone oxidoreductase subunit M
MNGENILAAQAGLSGAVFQMFNHGTISAMLFILVGVVYDRAHHRDIEGFGGLAKQMPIYAGVTMVAFFAGLGLPGMSGFVSEFLSFVGAFPVFRVIVILSTLGILLNAAYFLRAYLKIFFGPLNEKYASMPDINGRELFVVIPLIVITVGLGVYPSPFLNLIKTTLNDMITHIVQLGGAF